MKYAGTDVLKIMQKAHNYNHFLVDMCLKSLNSNYKTILDFGAGIGTFAELLSAKGFDVECVETDPFQAKLLKKNNFSTAYNIDHYEDNSLHNIVSFNVFEHIENDKEVLKQIYKKLASDGIFFLFVPANSNLYSAFDKQLGHYRRYNADELVELVEDCGFKIKKSEYFDCLGFFLALVYKCVNRTGRISSLSVTLFDKLIFPISVKLDKIFNRMFGKNYILILTKE